MPRAALLGLLLLSSASWAGEPLKIVGYPLQKLAMYDASGEFLGDIERERLPVPEVLVEHYDEDKSLLLIRVEGREVWLDPLDVKLNQGKTVAYDCRKVAETSAKADSQTKAVMGYSESCAQ